MEKEMEAKVLLVDDEQDFLETLSSRLELRGLKVSAVTSGEQAVAESSRPRPMGKSPWMCRRWICRALPAPCVMRSQ